MFQLLPFFECTWRVEATADYRMPAFVGLGVPGGWQVLAEYVNGPHWKSVDRDHAQLLRANLSSALDPSRVR